MVQVVWRVALIAAIGAVSCSHHSTVTARGTVQMSELVHADQSPGGVVSCAPAMSATQYPVHVYGSDGVELGQATLVPGLMPAKTMTVPSMILDAPADLFCQWSLRFGIELPSLEGGYRFVGPGGCQRGYSQARATLAQVQDPNFWVRLT